MTAPAAPASSTAAPALSGSQWAQTGPLGFSRTLTHTGVRISEVPELTIPSTGVWEITYHARASFKPTAKKALWVHTWLGRAGARIPGSEAISGSQAPDAETVQTTTGQTVIATFQAGDTVTLHGYYAGEGRASILSNGDGRTTVVARQVDPGP